MAQIIAVVSGKGGTGKTSLCAGAATALASRGCRVLCVDCDVGLRNLDLSLGLSDMASLSFLDLLRGDYTAADAPAHPSFPSLRFLTAPMNCDAEDIDSAAFQRLLRRESLRFDYIFLDAPAGVDAGFRLVSAAADRFLLVTGPGPGAMRDAARVGDLLELAGKTNVRLVVNRVNKGLLTSMGVTVDDVMDTAGLPLIGVVLEDSHVTLAAALGKSLLDFAPKCDAAKAFSRIASRIQGVPVEMKLK